MLANAVRSEAREPRPSEPELGDLRFRALMTEDDWAALAPPIRRRFSKRLADGNTVVYAGEIVEAWMSRAGWLLAQAARVIGAPLPLSTDTGVPGVVSVTEDMVAGGQVWTRLYARRNGFPQVIHSSKRFAGRTGLEEYVGHGIGMAMTIHAVDGALVFRSAGYFLDLFGRRIALPSWMTPGETSATHTEIGEGRFSFTLDVVHPWLGPIIRQFVIFREVSP